LPQKHGKDVTDMRYDLWALFGAATWPLWLLALGWICRRLERPRRGLWCQRAGFLLFLLVAVSPLSVWVMAPLERAVAARLPIRVETIVMLAGAEQLSAALHSGKPEYSEAAERLIAAAQLQRQFPQAQLLLVGGIQLPGGRVDVDYVRETLLALGVPDNKITRIATTRDTFGNASAVAQLRRTPSTMVLVTSAFHMPRAMLCFAHFGLHPGAYPVDSRVPVIRVFAPNMIANFKRFDDAVHEWVGLIFYRATGRINAILP
jgi:uncharacterized SAM-binding protein YcdF (DUF218 family)